MKIRYPFFLILFTFTLCISISCKKEKEENKNQDIPAEYLLPAVYNSNLTYGSMTDQDGNTYKTINIGTQTWMAENLKTTKYNDGSAIKYVTTIAEWLTLTSGAYCWYYDHIEAKAVYGAQYNWYAVNTGKLCPTGWHVPTDAEWMTLTNFLGGIGIAGGKMKEIGTTHWVSPNTDATNSSGFTGLPGGPLYSDGTFGDLGYFAIWWSSTENINSTAWSFSLNKGNGNVFRYNDNKQCGLFIRCLKE